MITSKQCLDRYGDPNLVETQNKHFEVWQVPQEIQNAFKHVRFSAVGTIGFPKKIFVNKDFKPLLEKALRNIISRGLTQELKTWDGVFIIRQKRGLSSLSLHSWALAVDINAEENGLGKNPKLSSEFVKCFTDVELEWGGTWARQDGMHFQLGKFTTPTKSIQTTSEKFYTVKVGDTLSKIAKENKTTVEKIQKDNNLKSTLIQINQKLKL